ncbi:MAG TPA: hypothetical protein VNT99_05095 [Methylomirabilota bacterium]|nr:hypothetical protein [Methylomirabilota bacterium]
MRVAAFGSAQTDFRLQIRAVRAPPNDNFENAEAISGVPVTVSGILVHASTETGEPETSGHGVWYSWIAPVSGLYFASVESRAGFVSVYTGLVLTNLISRGQYIYGLKSGSAFYATVGETCFISVGPWDSPPDASLPFTLSIEPHAPPPNDSFAQRLTIPAGTLSATGTCIGATSEPGEATLGERNSVWWRWVAPSAGVYRATVFVPEPPVVVTDDGFIPRQPGFPEGVSVYTGSALGNLTLVSASPHYLDDTWRAEAGVEYQLVVAGGAAFFSLNITPVPQPANDHFANAVLMAGTTAVRGTTSGAGLEPGEPAHGGFPPANGSVWYRWVAPSNGLFTLQTSASVKIFTGDTLVTLTRVNSNALSRVFRATAGVTYSIAVIDSRSFTLRVRPAFPPTNDDFAHGELLSGLNLGFTANLRDATAEPHEPRYPGGAAPVRTVWYSWTAPTNGNFLIQETNEYSSPFSSVRITVYTGNALTNLNAVTSSSYQTLDFDAIAGTTYHFSLDGDAVSTVEQFAMQLRFRPRPFNDAFSNRLALVGTNIGVTASNVAATVEPGEPEHGFSSARRSVWFSWTAPHSGRVSLVISGDFSAVLGLYTGNELSNLVRVLPLDYYTERLNVAVVEGTTYQLALDGYGQNSGTCTLNIHYATPPVNDDFANRLSLTNGQGSGTLEGASREVVEPEYGTDPFGSSVWWRWTPATNGIHYFRVEASGWIQVGVYTGTNLSSLPNALGGTVFYMNATPGVEYAIQISAFGGAFSTYNILIQHQPPPPNDHFEDRIAFTNSVAGTLKGATRQPGEALIASTNSGSVWFTWVAPQDGTFDVKVDSRGSFLQFQVYLGTNLASLAPVSQAVTWMTHGMVATAGTAYVIQVADYSDWSGTDFQLFVSPSAGPPPPPSPVLPPTRLAIGFDSRTSRLNIPVRPWAVVETSTNLVDWQPWRTNAVEGMLSVPIGTEPQRFFRVR